MKGGDCTFSKGREPVGLSDLQRARNVRVTSPHLRRAMGMVLVLMLGTVVLLVRGKRAATGGDRGEEGVPRGSRAELFTAE